MTKKLILFILVIIVFTSATKHNNFQNQENDKILWSSKRQLTWNDFRGEIPEAKGPFVAAVSACSITLEYETTVDSIMVDYKIKNYFTKSMSWTITTKDTGLLAHEQLHFDITELYSRKTRKSFDSLRFEKNRYLESYLEVYNSNYSKCQNFQYQYDQEVTGNNKNQQEWIKNVRTELIKLKEYEYIPEQ